VSSLPIPEDILTCYHQRSRALHIRATNTSRKSSLRRSHVYTVCLPSTVVQTRFERPPRSYLHRQHHTHPPCTPSHRNCGYRATYHFALSNSERSLGNGAPAYAHHHAATTRRWARPDRPVRLAVADAPEYHHGSG